MEIAWLIGGQCVAADGDGLPVLNPATGEPVMSVCEASTGQVDVAVVAATKVFATWGPTAG